MEAQTPSMRNIVYPWWLVLLQGLGAILVGILLLTAPGATVTFLVQVLGWYWLISGVLSIVSIFVSSRLLGWKLFSGILGIVAGFLIVSHPLWSAVLVPTTLTWVLGIYGFIAGLVLLIGAAQGGGWGMAALGALAILLGIALIAAPFVATLGVIIAAGVLSIIGGIIALINALDLRREEKAREGAVTEAVRTAERYPVEEDVQIVERSAGEEATRTAEQPPAETGHVQVVERPTEEDSATEEERERMDTR